MKAELIGITIVFLFLIFDPFGMVEEKKKMFENSDYFFIFIFFLFDL